MTWQRYNKNLKKSVLLAEYYLRILGNKRTRWLKYRYDNEISGFFFVKGITVSSITSGSL